MPTDLRYAFRLLLRQRATTALVVLTLALGIGATSAMFSVIHGVLLRPLPYDAPERVVRVHPYSPQQAQGDSSTPADYLDLARDVRGFEAMAGFIDQVIDFSDGAGDPERVSGTQVTERFFDVFGVPAALGRTFDSAHATADRGTAVVLRHSFWQKRLGGSATAIGRQVRVNGQPKTIVGVMPPDFGFRNDEALWLLAPRDIPDSPMDIPGDLRASRELGYMDIVARTRADVGLTQAQAEVDRVMKTLAERFPKTNAQRGMRLTPLKEDLVGGFRAALLVLLGAVGCVLLIACANVANLLLARASDRHREMAIRTALGAARGRLVRQLLFEGLLLAAIGGVLGLLVARWGVQLLIALAPEDVPRLAQVRVDLFVAAFTCAVCVLTGVLFGMAPALQTTRVTPQDVLREASTRTVGGRRARLTRSLLVVSQLALALVLVVGASLMVTSFSRLGAVDPGFRSDQVMSISMPLPGTRYPTMQRQSQFYEQMLERVRATGVARGATMGFPGPLRASDASANFGLDALGRPGEKGSTSLALIASDYFRTLGVPMLQGRDFTDQDAEKSPRVVIVNRAFARKYFPNDNAVGKRLKIASDTEATIVGLVGDVRGYGLDREAPPITYLPYRQFTLPYMSVLVRTTADAGQVASTMRGILRQLDPEMPLDKIEPLDRVVSNTIAQPRFRTTLLSTFALAALILAIVGVYGVISYTVAQRRREMGIRAALGATPADLLTLVLRQGLTLALAGIVTGLAAALALSSLLSGLLYGVAATDPTTLFLATLSLILVAAVACALPAWRTMRLDPLAALRDD